MESINSPKLDSHYYRFIGNILFITLHSFDAVLCLMIVLDYTWKILLFWFLLHCFFIYLFFCKFCKYSMCTSAPYRITMKTQILGAVYVMNMYMKYMLSILKCHFKCISEKYIKPISEKYIKSRLKVYFPIV